jgi:putative ABC transport system substrate-binding protein
MRRREFIALVGGAAACPFAANAQQPRKLPTIGFLGANTASSQQTDAFVQRLRELGWTDGSTVAIEYRWAEGRFDRAPALVAELVQLKVDVLVTHSTPNVIAAKQSTSVIPIVFAAVGDPVGIGLVQSLSRRQYVASYCCSRALSRHQCLQWALAVWKPSPGLLWRNIDSR